MRQTTSPDLKIAGADVITTWMFLKKVGTNSEAVA